MTLGASIVIFSFFIAFSWLTINYKRKVNGSEDWFVNIIFHIDFLLKITHESLKSFLSQKVLIKIVPHCILYFLYLREIRI